MLREQDIPKTLIGCKEKKKEILNSIKRWNKKYPTKKTKDAPSFWALKILRDANKPYSFLDILIIESRISKIINKKK